MNKDNWINVKDNLPGEEINGLSIRVYAKDVDYRYIGFFDLPSGAFMIEWTDNPKSQIRTNSITHFLHEPKKDYNALKRIAGDNKPWIPVEQLGLDSIPKMTANT